LAQNFVLVRKLHPTKNTKFGAENTHSEEFVGKIKILSIQNLLCPKFAAVRRKI